MVTAAHKINSFPEIEEAQRVLEAEAQALLDLSQGLDGEFSQAIKILQSVEGRVIVTGIGKSGHIANKIAATLASTGTPAFFVHPSEASHGDLGMITQEDVLIMLSNSGETSELFNLMEYAKRFSIPMIAITSNRGSSLARASSASLVLPPCGEACPLGLAPTTSTTLMLALGDALAVTLLNQKGFAATDFKAIHPGGKLGQQLALVREMIRPKSSLPLVSPDMLMSDALMVMTEKGLGCLGVVDESNALLGVITDGDLRRHMSPDLLAEKASDIMTPNPKTLKANVLAAEAVAFMNANGITNLFVLDELTDELVGVLNMHDCLRLGVK